MGVTGLELTHPALSGTLISNVSGAKCGAPRTLSTIQDTNLSRLIELWPMLPEAVQQGILAIVGTALNRDMT